MSAIAVCIGDVCSASTGDVSTTSYAMVVVEHGMAVGNKLCIYIFTELLALYKSLIYKTSALVHKCQSHGYCSKNFLALVA